MYFQGAPEIQPDGLQTLYLMNPSYVTGYSDATAVPAAQQNNMLFLNSPLSSLNSIPLQQPPPQQQQHFVGIPRQPSSEKPSRPLQPMQTAPVQSNLWAPALPTNAGRIDIQSQLGPRRPGLLLSLSPQQAQFTAASGGDKEAKIAGGCSSSSNGPGLHSVMMGSKYLKAAQELLDEVVSVGRGEALTAKVDNSPSMKKAKDLDRDGDGDGNGKKAAELSTAERQELQMKKANLVNMLDEVEQRYRQYHHQMQSVKSSFEAVAGFGSAKTYTALALQTISKQFRCLRDAISRQIRVTSKSLGEDECMIGGGGGGSKSVGSRLRFVDHQLRQQKALQQLGMAHHNAWRPQRGLPERAVSVLRSWLFEHFLHPYPKDSDKLMLAKQTGLTRSQVSNWFINARVRLWKPMVEEMYLEETKQQEKINNGGDNKTSNGEASKHSASKSTSQQANTGAPTRTELTDNNPTMTVPSSDLAMFDNHNDEAIMQRGPKKQRIDESLMEVKPGELSNRELLMKFMDQGAGFGAYPIAEIGRFDHEQFAPRYAGNGVSLTLGLPHCESLPLSGSQQASYLSNESMHLGRGLELSSEESIYFSLSDNNGNNASASNAYESINTQNRKRFAAQLLPDFVA